MAVIFRKLTDSDEDAMQLALEFYGPMYLLYSAYDGAEEKESVSSLLATHIDRFIAKIEAGYRAEAAGTAVLKIPVAVLQESCFQLAINRIF